MTPRQATHDDIICAIGELKATVQAISDDLAVLKDDVAGLVALKNQGMGAVAALTLTGALILMGLKSWFAGLFGR